MPIAVIRRRLRIMSSKSKATSSVSARRSRVSLTSLEQAGGSCAKADAADATIWSGVFSDIQARRGERVASVSCSGCHGPDLEGGDSGPKLVGPTFLTSWREKTVGDLFVFVKTEMPADAPDSLSPQDTANVIATYSS